MKTQTRTMNGGGSIAANAFDDAASMTDELGGFDPIRRHALKTLGALALGGGLVTMATRGRASETPTLSAQAVREVRFVDIDTGEYSYVVGGHPAMGIITLDRRAPAGGTVVLLRSNNSTLASVPTRMTIEAGRRRGQFRIKTFPVSRTRYPTISAITKGGTNRARDQVAIHPPSLLAIRGPASMPSGTTATGKVVLNGRAPAGGTVVRLDSGPEDNEVRCVSRVTIPEGKRTKTFRIRSLPIDFGPDEYYRTGEIDGHAGGWEAFIHIKVTR